MEEQSVDTARPKTSQTLHAAGLAESSYNTVKPLHNTELLAESSYNTGKSLHTTELSQRTSNPKTVNTAQTAKFPESNSTTVKTLQSAKSLERNSDGRQAAQEFLPPTMLEVLGDHLYTKIEEVQEAYHVDLDVAKITGVLLELGEEQVLKLLQDEALLQQSVKRVVQHVPAVCSNIRHWSLLVRDDAESSPRSQPESETDPEDAELLYERVFQQEPSLSHNITGMLLELGASEVKSLLQSPAKLTEAVTRARAVCFHQNHSPPHSSPRERKTMVTLKHPKSSNTTEEGGLHTCRLNEDETEANTDRNSISTDGDQECRESHGRESMVDESDQTCTHVFKVDSAEELGEVVYAEVEKLYPESAAKLTGMVLDMGQSRVRQLLQDRALLHKAIHMAFTSLSYST